MKRVDNSDNFAVILFSPVSFTALENKRKRSQKTRDRSRWNETTLYRVPSDEDHHGLDKKKQELYTLDARQSRYAAKQFYFV